MSPFVSGDWAASESFPAASPSSSSPLEVLLSVVIEAQLMFLIGCHSHTYADDDSDNIDQAGNDDGYDL